MGVAPMPDPRLGLPEPGAAVVGQVVHGVLQAVVDGACDRQSTSLEEALQHGPCSVPWPDPERLERLLHEVASRTARRMGLDGLGLSRLLAAQARPYLEVARRVEWGEDGVLDDVLGAEVKGRAEIAEIIGEAVPFRADRVDRRAHGVVLTDYKNGRPPSDAKTAAKRREHLASFIARGRGLQGSAYARSGGPGSAEGRYLYLRPEIPGPEESRTFRIASDDVELEGIFLEAVSVIVEAWRAGAFFPRVEEPDGSFPPQCRWCPILQACLRDDSAYRRRLVEVMDGEGDGVSEPLSKAQALWWMGWSRDGEER
jgi:hypothetical protein